MAPEPVVRRLVAGGNRIRTIGTALAKGLSVVAEGERRTDKLDGSLNTGRVARRQRSAAGPLSTALSFSAGPMVRIRFPPAESLQTFGSSRAATADRVSPATMLYPFMDGAVGPLV